MSEEQIKSHLKQLHQELANIGTADEETRTMLQELDADIHELLSPSDTPSEQVESIRDRLDEMAIEFSTSHPKAGIVLRELMDLLAKIGV